LVSGNCYGVLLVCFKLNGLNNLLRFKKNNTKIIELIIKSIGYIVGCGDGKVMKLGGSKFGGDYNVIKK